jgi:DNA-binding transcriptional LysR family regulator
MLNSDQLARVDLNLLVLFETVFEERHVARAAARLSLSPSAISHGLRRLRELLHDPLFLRHPRGVVPTERAVALAAQVSSALAQVRQVVAAAEPFDPSRSARRFTVGAPDGIAAVALPPAIAAVRRTAPGVDLSIRELQPGDAIAALDAREVDIALHPLDDVPARCVARALFEEDFVIAMRAGRASPKTLSAEAYCAAQHVLVSQRGDRHGFVDEVLATHGLTRRVVVTVPSFMWALAMLAETDLLAAVPRSLVRAHGARFGVVAAEPPVPLGRFRILAVATQAAMADAGVAWLMDLLESVAPQPRRARQRSRAIDPIPVVPI